MTYVSFCEVMSKSSHHLHFQSELAALSNANPDADILHSELHPTFQDLRATYTSQLLARADAMNTPHPRNAP